MFLAIVTLLGFSVCLLGITCTAFSQDNFGVILVAHKSTRPNWNRLVKQLHNNIVSHFNPTANQQPIELAFLDFKDNSQEHTLKEAIRKMLMEKGMNEILLVPLFPFSEIYNGQILEKANAEAASLNLPSPTNIVIASAMDGNSYAISMLTRCAAGLSHTPSQESLLLVSYGPYDDTVNNTVLANLRLIGEAIKNQVGFSTFDVETLRPHHFGNNPKKDVEAIKTLRETARTLKKDGLVIVVPYVIQGDFYKELKHYLSGVVHPPQICSQKLISQPETEEWVKWAIGGGMDQSQHP